MIYLLPFFFKDSSSDMPSALLYKLQQCHAALEHIYASEEAVSCTLPESQVRNWLHLEKRLLDLAAAPGVTDNLLYGFCIQAPNGCVLRYFESGEYADSVMHWYTCTDNLET